MDIRNIIDTKDMPDIMGGILSRFWRIQAMLGEAKSAAEVKPLDRLRAQWDAAHSRDNDHNRLEAQGCAEAGEE